MDREELKGKMEAILFAGGDAVALERIAQVLGTRVYVIEELAAELQEKYNTPQSGIHLLLLENSAQFCTNPAFIQPVRDALELKRNTPLSQAAMEVLAVVAYNQPVTKAFVEQVRGVDCSGVIGSLVQKGLLEERGRMELPRQAAAVRHHRKLFAVLRAVLHRRAAAPAPWGGGHAPRGTGRAPADHPVREAV